ncbi:hypothetical protein [Frankia sp. R82]|uniref:hypothetical protein n=1 Tax=Frankia sp. R82 TaxID=2950553 RepID=UPI00204399E8|nr:hypothetical protein [Frankia sp. R82]MCM3887034.1 hypothetical protein [Frankia sp. R82]
MDDKKDTIRGYLSSTEDPPRTEVVHTSCAPAPTSAPLPAPAQAPPPFAGADRLLTTLVSCAEDAFTGSLDVVGAASGRVAFQDGLIIDAVTSAAPGVESLLLRSGRIAEPEWTAVYAAAAPTGQLAALLVERGLLGRAGVQILARTSVMDALFALAGSAWLEVTRTPARTSPDAAAAPLLPVQPGVDAGWAVREISRRLTIAGGWHTYLGLGPQTRPRLAPEPARMPTAAPQVSLLARVNGRRTARDLAFSLGRGIYPVLTDLAFLATTGWIVLSPSSGHPPSAVPEPTDRSHPVCVAPPAPRPYGDRYHRIPPPATGDTVAPTIRTPKRRYDLLIDNPLPRRPIHTPPLLPE